MSVNHSVDQVADALREHHGIVLAAAKRLGVTRQAMSKRIADSPTLQRVLEEARESMTDTAEAALYRSIIDGDAWAVQFYLKTQGKGRGYVERTEQRAELTGKDGAPLVFTIAIDRTVADADLIPG